MFKKYLSVILIPIVLILVSCSGLIAGAELREQIEADIEYQRAQEITVRVVSDEGAGTTYPAGDSTFKVGYEKEISFEENSSFVFSSWKAYAVTMEENGEKETLTDNVEFENPYSLKTKVKILRTSGELIKIRAICHMKPFIYSKYPQYPKDNEVLNNSSITIAFSTPNGLPIEKNSFYFTNAELSKLNKQQSDLSFLYDSKGDCYGYESYNSITYKNIEIESNGDSILGYFGAPIINDTLVIIPVASEKGISLGDSKYKDIKVTLGNSIYCELDDGIKIPIALSESNTWNYRIKDSAAVESSAVIQFVDNKSIESMSPVQATYSYSISTKIDISAKPDSENTFLGWRVTTPTGIYEYDGFSEDKSVSVPNESGKVALVIENGTLSSTSLFVKDGISSVVISPVCKKIPVAQIKTSSTEGKVTPEGNFSYMLGKTFDLTFNPDTEYAFSYWQIKVNGNTLNTQEVHEYLEIDCSKADNTVKLKKVPEIGEIQFTPICNVRPRVLSHSPDYVITGSLRDTRIKVIFDSKMSEKAFFWTKDELEAEGITTEGGYSIFEYTKAKNSDGKTLYYAYCLKVNGVNELSTLNYKNITIINRKTKENLLRYYNEPYYEDTSKEVLVIPSKQTTSSVPACTDVYVTIGKNAVDEKDVSLASSLTWCYLTGGQDAYDQDAPDLKITTGVLKTYHSSNGDNNGRALTLLPSVPVATDYTTLDRSNIENLKRTNMRFSISGSVEDTGSLPAEVIIKVKKVDTSFYNNNSSGEKAYVERLIPENNIAYFDIDSDLSELFDGEGIYEITVSASDNSNNIKTNYYDYIVYDETKPILPVVEKSYSKNGGINLKLALPKLENDIKQIQVTANGVSVDYVSNGVKQNDVMDFSSLINGTQYDITITSKDCAGNTNTTIWKEYAGLAVGQYYYYDGNSKKYSSYYYSEMKNQVKGIITSVDNTSTPSGKIISSSELSGQKTLEDIQRDFSISSNLVSELSFRTGVTHDEAIKWLNLLNEVDSGWMLPTKTYTFDVSKVNTAINEIGDSEFFTPIMGASYRVYGKNAVGRDMWTMAAYWTQSSSYENIHMGTTDDQIYKGFYKTNFSSSYYDRSGAFTTSWLITGTTFERWRYYCLDYGYVRAFKDIQNE